VLSGVVVFAAQPTYTYAQTINVERVREVAQRATVSIQSSRRPDLFGSGVIIQRNGNTYTVLTAKHVVDLADEYQITAGSQTYRVQPGTVQQLPNLDLAILQFESERAYPPAQIASIPVRALDRIFVAGYPKPTASVPTVEFTISPGDVNTLVPESQAREGYGLRYGARIRAGMTGGPVLNEQGQLVAIHGRADELGGLGVPLGSYQDRITTLIQGAEQSSKLARAQAEQQRQAELERQQQAAAEKQRQAQLEQQRQAELERQKQAELARQQAEKERQAEQARQQQAAAEKQRQAEQEQQRQAELRAQQEQQQQQLAQLASIEPFAPPPMPTPAVETRPAPPTPNPNANPEVCEWVAFGGQKVKRCSGGNRGGAPSSDTAPPAPNPPDFVSYLNRGNEFVAQGQYSKAVSEYTRAIAAKPDYAYAYFNRGLSLARMGQDQQALTDLRKAQELFQAKGQSAELSRVQNTITIISRARTTS
jgi:tetratricopeptide (TPR) repeat protein